MIDVITKDQAIAPQISFHQACKVSIISLIAISRYNYTITN
jgi:hypothetical protein